MSCFSFPPFFFRRIQERRSWCLVLTSPRPNITRIMLFGQGNIKKIIKNSSSNSQCSFSVASRTGLPFLNSSWWPHYMCSHASGCGAAGNHTHLLVICNPVPQGLWHTTYNVSAVPSIRWISTFCHKHTVCPTSYHDIKLLPQCLLSTSFNQGHVYSCAIWIIYVTFDQ